MALDGIIFDLDGTLVDTNALHVEAFRRVFERHGYKISADRIFPEIGKGGDKLVPDILGKEAEAKDGDALREEQPKEYARVAQERGLKVLPGAQELLAELRRRGIGTVIATSSDKSQLEATQKASGVRWEELVDGVVTSSDAEQSKPNPDIVAAAARKLRMSPAQCAMVGDTPYDAQAAKHAGVICLGVTSGGHDVQTLISGGARAVWRGPADLLTNLDEALRIASPGPAHLTQELLEELMREALKTAEEGVAAGEVPIGCVLARGDGSVIARGFNELNKTGNPTAHAEIVTFAKAAGNAPPEARDLILVSTLEPCVMCLGASMVSAVDTVVYALRAPADSGTGRVSPPSSPESQMPRIVGDVLAAESRALFKRWLERSEGKSQQQVQFVEQLLEST